MAPRTGPQGVTNQDVANRAGVTFLDASRPSTQTPVDQAALLSYLLGPQAPGYGQKYGGFPTATYGQAAVEGQAFAIADLARQAFQQAAINKQELENAAEQDYRNNQRAIASKYRYAQPSQQVSQAAAAVGEADDPAQKMLARAKLQATIGRESASRKAQLDNLQTTLSRQLDADIASQVTPYQQVFESLAYSPSQLAQQIAVSRYGYDPMLASGLFGGATDLKYDTQVRSLEEAQRRAMGYDTSLSNDEILAQRMTPEEFANYQLAKADAAYQNVFEPDYTEIDRNIQQSYGVDPASIVNVDTDVAREAMSDDTFLASVNSYRDLMATNEDRYVSGEAAANAYAKEYLERSADPVRAQILLDILRQYSFLIGP